MTMSFQVNVYALFTAIFFLQARSTFLAADIFLEFTYSKLNNDGVSSLPLLFGEHIIFICLSRFIRMSLHPPPLHTRFKKTADT